MRVQRKHRYRIGVREAWQLAAAAAALLGLVAGCGTIIGSLGDHADPIVVMTWAPVETKATNQSGMLGMAEAFAKSINDRGGLAGRKIKALTCNEGNERLKAAACAEKAVNAGAVAVIGSYSQFASAFMPILENAGIPYIGGYGLTTEEFTSPLSYPVNGGIPALLAGNGRQLADYNCGHVSLVRPDTASGDLLPSFLDAGLEAGHLGPAADIRAPDDANDYTTQAKRAVGTDALGSCVTAVLGDHTDAFFDSYRRLDTTNTRLASVLGSFQQSLVDSTGGASGPLEGVFATGWYPPITDARWDRMREAVRTYAFGDSRIDTAAPGEQTTWLAYTVFASVTRSLGDGHIDAKAVKRALDATKGVDTGGLTPKLSWRTQDLLALSDYPRMVNTAVTYQVVRSGQLAPLRRGFVDVRSLLENDAGLG